MKHNSDIIIDSHIEKIKKNAIDLKNGKVKTFDDAIFFVKFWLADYYKIPSKSEIFDEYTVEELFFEYYYLNAVEQKKDAAAIIRDSAKEIATLFSDEEKAAMDKIFENDVNWSLNDLKKG